MEAVWTVRANAPRALVAMIARSTSVLHILMGALAMANVVKMDVCATTGSGDTTAPAQPQTAQIIAPAMASARTQSALVTLVSPVQTVAKSIRRFLAHRTAPGMDFVIPASLPRLVFACRRGSVTSATRRSTVVHQTSTIALAMVCVLRQRRTIRLETGPAPARPVSAVLRVTVSARPAQTTALVMESALDPSVFATQDSPAATAPS